MGGIIPSEDQRKENGKKKWQTRKTTRPDKMCQIMRINVDESLEKKTASQISPICEAVVRLQGNYQRS
jgi:hypothetical protein